MTLRMILIDFSWLLKHFDLRWLWKQVQHVPIYKLVSICCTLPLPILQFSFYNHFIDGIPRQGFDCCWFVIVIMCASKQK